MGDAVIRLRVLPALIPSNAEVEVGTVTTLAPGEDATVVNSGTPSAVVLDFGIPAGEPGDPGDPGVVQTIVAGSNITVDATDPANPIISSAGGAVSDGDKGDIVVSSSGTIWSIDAGVIVNADINASAAIDATKIANGNVTSTEFQYLDGVTSAIQTQIDGKQPLDADLTTWAGLTPSANAQSLVTAANYAAMRSLLDLEAGTDFYSIAAANAAFQPIDADLTSWAGVTRAAGFDTFAATPSSANLRSLLSDEVGTGAAYFVGGALGTPASATLTNGTGLPVASGISGLGTGVATFLATPSSANLAAALTDETGTGSAVFSASPALTGTPTAPTAAPGTNTTQLASTAFVLANAGGSLVDSQQPTTDQTTVASTGFSAYRHVEVLFAFTHNNASAGTNTIDARVSGGTWRTILSFTTEADATSSFGGGVVISNFNQAAQKVANANVRRSTNVLDASDASTSMTTVGFTGVVFAAWSEVWDEVRINSSVASSIEGDTADQRGSWYVRGYN